MKNLVIQVEQSVVTTVALWLLGAREATDEKSFESISTSISSEYTEVKEPSNLRTRLQTSKSKIKRELLLKNIIDLNGLLHFQITNTFLRRLKKTKNSLQLSVLNAFGKTEQALWKTLFKTGEQYVTNQNPSIISTKVKLSRNKHSLSQASFNKHRSSKPLQTEVKFPKKLLEGSSLKNSNFDQQPLNNLFSEKIASHRERISSLEFFLKKQTTNRDPNLKPTLLKRILGREAQVDKTNSYNDKLSKNLLESAKYLTHLWTSKKLEKLEPSATLKNEAERSSGDHLRMYEWSSFNARMRLDRTYKSQVIQVAKPFLKRMSQQDLADFFFELDSETKTKLASDMELNLPIKSLILQKNAGIIIKPSPFTTKHKGTLVLTSYLRKYGD